MPQCAIFDMDGVLVDSYEAHFTSWREVAAVEGITITEADFAWSFGRTSREIIESWTLPGMDAERSRSIDTRKEQAFRRIINHEFPIMAGARELIARLRAAGFRIALGSSAPPENVDLALEKVGRDLFDGVVNGMEVARGKPDPQVFQLAASRAGALPQDCVVIEDARPGIQAAHNAGMASVALVSTGRHETDFADLEVGLIVRSLGELSPEILSALLAARRRASN